MADVKNYGQSGVGRDLQLGKQGPRVISDEANPQITYGRQFDHNNSLYSKLTRESIDALKEHFKDEMTKES